MAWPHSQDYNEAIQSPATHFADPDLRGGQPVLNPLGIPLPSSGNFADVYEICGPGGARWAVKCFTREVPGLRERYQEISRHLSQTRLPFIVDFHYLEQGIRVAGRWYPLVKMPWIEGLTLNAFAAQYADKPAMLEALLPIWQKMAHHLRKAGVAHCDLQHGNVLLVPGSNTSSLALKLIDYDGMFVPALAGRPSGEVGHPSYQHPGRAQTSAYNLEVDRFPLLLITTALQALKVGGLSLWAKYDNGDNLLFQEADLRDPQQSLLFRELATLGDPLVATLTKHLLLALHGGLESAPLLEAVMFQAQPAQPAETQKARPESTPVAVPAGAIPVVHQENGDGKDPWDLGEAATVRGRHTRARKAEGRVPLALWIGGISVSAIVLLIGALGIVFLPSGKSPSKANPDLSGVEQRAKTNKDPVKPPYPGAKKSADKISPIQPVKVHPDAGSKQMAQPDEIDPQPAGPIGQVRHFEGHTAEIRRLAVSPDGRQLLTASFDKTLRLWDVASGREVRQWVGHGGQWVHGVAFLSDGRRALSGGFDRGVFLWDLKFDRMIRSYSGHEQRVWDVVVSGDDRVAASCGEEPTVVLWDVKTGKELRRLEGNTGGVECVALSADGRFALTGARQGLIRLWDVETGTELRPLKGHRGQVMGVAFSPDARFALSVGLDKTARIWRLENGQEVGRFEGHSSFIYSSALSADGGRALTGSVDSTVRLWDVETNRELFSFQGHQGQVWTVAFSPDGRYAYSAGQDKVVRMWRLPPPGSSPPVSKEVAPLQKPQDP
jgi:hypothetical protein